MGQNLCIYSRNRLPSFDILSFLYKSYHLNQMTRLACEAKIIRNSIVFRKLSRRFLMTFSSTCRILTFVYVLASCINVFKSFRTNAFKCSIFVSTGLVQFTWWPLTFVNVATFETITFIAVITNTVVSFFVSFTRTFCKVTTLFAQCRLTNTCTLLSVAIKTI